MASLAIFADGRLSLRGPLEVVGSLVVDIERFVGTSFDEAEDHFLDVEMRPEIELGFPNDAKSVADFKLANSIPQNAPVESAAVEDLPVKVDDAVEKPVVGERFQSLAPVAARATTVAKAAGESILGGGGAS